MKSLVRGITAVATVTALVGALSIAPAASATAPYPMTTGYYGKRYCEFLLVKLQATSPLLHIQVWNTYPLNTCPTVAWDASTTSAALKSMVSSRGMDAVSVNGPRWWAMNRAGATINPEVTTLGSVTMRHFADVDIDAPPALWAAATVKRTSTFIYDKGTYIHQLTSPTGHKYVMQSWTTMISPKVTEKTLKTLASGKSPLLKLPRGWKYSTLKLTKQLSIVAAGTMSVLQDNLKNSYSMIS